MKKLFIITIFVSLLCASLSSCGVDIDNDRSGVQYKLCEVVCCSKAPIISDTYFGEAFLIKDSVKAPLLPHAEIYVTADMKLFKTEKHSGVQSLWEEVGTLSEKEFVPTEESGWTDADALANILDNAERTYSLLTDKNKSVYLILLKDRTAFLAISDDGFELIIKLEETEATYYEDVKKDTYEIYTFSVSASAKDHTAYYGQRILCLYKNKTGFFLQCAENKCGGIYGAVSETENGYLLTSKDGEYKIRLTFSEKGYELTVEDNKSITFIENIKSEKGNGSSKLGEYYYSLDEDNTMFDSFEKDFDGDGTVEKITVNGFPLNNGSPLLGNVISIPYCTVNCTLWEKGEIKSFAFLPFDGDIRGISFYEDEDGNVFAEVAEIKYKQKQYSGVYSPPYWEAYNETVTYKVTADQSGFYFTKT